MLFSSIVIFNLEAPSIEQWSCHPAGCRGSKLVPCNEMLCSYLCQALKEENYSLSQRLEQKERMEVEYQDEIDSLKKHLTSQRDELTVLRSFGDHSALLSELRGRVSVSLSHNSSSCIIYWVGAVPRNVQMR